MSNDVAHKTWWQIFEVIFGIPFLAALGLQRVIPVSIPHGFLTTAVLPAGTVLIVAGIGLSVLARREFSRHAQPTDPGLPTSKIVTTGVFSISRNPLYLGGILILAGISFVFDLPWVLILLVPSIVVCYYVLIVPEENYLATKFGEQYRVYAMTVHRWIGRKW
jgi:protein-S-isoprenylcysteine O-methyltransferase Ste14